MLTLGSSWTEDVIPSSFFPSLFLLQYSSKSISVFVLAFCHICTPPVVKENLRGGGYFSFLYTFQTAAASSPSFWIYRGMKEGI